MSAGIAPRRVGLLDAFESVIRELDELAPYWSEDFESEEVWHWLTQHWPALQSHYVPMNELARRCLEELEQALDDDEEDAPLFI